MFQTLAKLAALTLGSTLVATTAFAHALLQQAVPAVGGSVKGSPSQLLLRFSEGVEPRFSSVRLAGAGGGAVAVGPISVGGPDGATVTVRLARSLKPGTYTVSWRVTSVDSHKTQGTYSFTVEP